MGKEARVMAEIGEWFGDGKLLLETDDLMFRGARKLTIPLSGISAVRDVNGWLEIDHADGTARFDLGSFTTKWIEAIKNPRTRADKLDAKAGIRVGIVNVPEPTFHDEVRERTEQVEAPLTDGARAVQSMVGTNDERDLDILYLGIAAPDDIGAITTLRKRVKQTGAIWVIHPKGDRTMSHDAIMAVARPSGLVDVKSARFSETHGALKLMVPRSMRTSS